MLHEFSTSCHYLSLVLSPLLEHVLLQLDTVQNNYHLQIPSTVSRMILNNKWYL